MTDDIQEEEESTFVVYESVPVIKQSADEEQLSLLVHRFNNGDSYAFERLFEHVTPCIKQVISRFVYNYDDAQDLTQEVAINLYNALPGFRNDCKVLTFVYRVAFNVCINCKKRLTRTPQTFTEISSADNVEVVENKVSVNPHSTPEHDYMRKEKDTALHALISSLEPNFRAVLVMTDVCGMSQQEIADILRIPLNTVKTRQKRAREQMKKKILSNRELFGRVG